MSGAIYAYTEDTTTRPLLHMLADQGSYTEIVDYTRECEYRDFYLSDVWFM